jgi:hypothetical protein
MTLCGEFLYVLPPNDDRPLCLSDACLPPPKQERESKDTFGEKTDTEVFLMSSNPSTGLDPKS